MERATLNGTVRDPGGLAVSGAKVELLNSATGAKRQAETNETGIYLVAQVPNGDYTVTVSMDGFKTVKIDGVKLSVGERRTLDVALEVGTVSTQVEVTAGATPVDQSSSEIGTAVGEAQLKQIPINGRNWTALMLLAPGATNTGEGNQNSIRFFGRPRDENNWNFDGVDATGVKDPRQEGNLRLVISLDSIAEFRVSSAAYTAEGGGGGGGLVNLVSKTGTNEFHGSAFWFLRNNYFDARRPFDPSTVPPFRLNQYGANVGGPIAKNRLFFFANYEGLRQRLTTASVNGLVPSESFRTRLAAAQPSLRNLINAYPRGTVSVNPDVDRFFGLPKDVRDEDSGMIRVDYRITDSHSLFGRFNTTRGFISEPRTALLETRDSNIYPTQGTVQLQSVFGPTIVNEARIAVNRSALERTALGVIPESVRIPGFTNTQSVRAEIEKPTSYSILDNYTRVVGRHTVKTGFEARRIHANIADSQNTTIVFGSVANLFANRLDSFSIGSRYPMLGARRTYWFYFAQDEFKIKPNLTVNLGLRYENYGLAKEQFGRANVLDLERCGGYCPQGEPWYFRDDNNFAPRASLAWAPNFLKNRTVFRMGGGLYYSPGQTDDVNAPLDSFAEGASLTVAQQPALSYPIDPFLPQARSTGITPRAIQRDRRDAYTSTWTFSIQQQLPGSFVGQVAYVGNKGTHLFGRDRVNALDPVTRRQPFPTFGSVDRKVNYNRSNFHGLQASLNRNFTKNWLFQSQYLFGKAIDDNAGSGEGQELMIVSCRRCDRGPADFDIRQTFTANSIYDLPWGRDKVWGGWSVSGFFFARTGRAVNVTVVRAVGVLPDGNNVPPQRPDYVAGQSLYASSQTPDSYLNRGAFAVPAANTWGNLGRNVARGPGLWQLDTALVKRTRLTERVNLEFRTEAFNLFNRAQFGNPANNISNSNFGAIQTTANDGATGAGTSRQLQFALRLNF